MMLLLMLYIFIMIIFLSLYRFLKYKLIYVILLVVGLAGVVSLPVYSGADEAAHFDYINFVLSNHSLPTTYNLINNSQLLSLQNYTHVQRVPSGYQHEAFQPPLYYLLASVAGFLLSLVTENLLYRLYLIRMIGVLLLLVSVYFVEKTYQLLIKNEIINDNQLLFTSICCLFFLSPNMLSILIPVNNEHLVVALVSLLIYFLIYLLFEKQKNSFLLPISGSVIVASLALTKLTTSYFSLFLGGLILYKNGLKNTIFFVVLLSLLIMPWLGFNYVNYGKLTAADEHIKIVKPIVNPRNIDYNVNDLTDNFHNFISSVWFNDMRNIKIPLITDFLTMILIFSIISQFIIMFKKGSIIIKEKKSNNHFFETTFFSSLSLSVLFSIPIVLNFLILVSFSFFSNINFVLNRYFFMNLINFIFLFYLSMDIVKEEYKNLATSVFILITCFFVVLNFNNYFSLHIM